MVSVIVKLRVRRHIITLERGSFEIVFFSIDGRMETLFNRVSVPRGLHPCLTVCTIVCRVDYLRVRHSQI